ncbi:MAG: S-methyl-5'-thioadenosine phosphorylase, partial [Verrucomicrobiota bacterium]
TFFGHGIVAHISFAEPVCPDLRAAVFSVITDVIESNKAYHGLQVRDRGTYVNMEGPAFSTKAESNVYRQLGFDVIGMTSLPEAKLCREAEICYASIAMVTDYDCWMNTGASVSVEMILDNLRANTQLAHDVLNTIAGRLPPQRTCACAHALEHAIITSPELIPQPLKESLAPIVGKYLGGK